MQRPGPSMVVATTALVLAAGGVGWAASLPKNSVGSPQIRNGGVRSVDIRNGGVRLVDLAPDARIAGPQGVPGAQGPQGPQGPAGPSPFAAIGGTSSMSSCAACALATTGVGTVVARTYAAPPSTTGWASTGTLMLGGPTRVVIHASAVIAADSNGDVTCTVTESGQPVATASPVRILAGSAQTVVVDGVANLQEGERDLRLQCKGSDHRWRSAALTFVARA